MIDNVRKISNLMLMVGKYCKINVKTRLIYFDIASSSENQGLIQINLDFLMTMQYRNISI